MKHKNVVITLAQEPDAKSYKVLSLTNTCQLSIGQLVDFERVERWCALEGVTVRIEGCSVEESEVAQVNLLSDKKSKPRKGQLELSDTK